MTLHKDTPKSFWERMRMIHGPDVGPPPSSTEGASPSTDMTDELSRRRDEKAEKARGPVPKTIAFPCSFCGGDTTKGDVATFTLSWRDRQQYWFGHAQCFVNALEPKFRDLRPEWASLDIESENDDAS